MDLKLTLQAGAPTLTITHADATITELTAAELAQPVTLDVGDTLTIAPPNSTDRWSVIAINLGPEMLDGKLISADETVAERYNLPASSDPTHWGASVVLDGWGGDCAEIAQMPVVAP